MENLIAEVNCNDEIIKYSEKSYVHHKGLLHRAFSIFAVNYRGEVLLHKRAYEKYHSPGLWTNTCCSHLSEGMEMEDAIHLRLREEMGFDTDLQYVGKFHYKAEFNNGLVENEIDHIYIGLYNDNPTPNPEEVADYRWCNLDELKRDIEKNPNIYTYWLKHIVKHHWALLENSIQQILVAS